jgi:serine/threonine protein kinase
MPTNLLLDVWGIVWLTDFGLAKATGTEDLTAKDDLIGTLRYVPPERFEGTADVRGNVYSLGLTLYEMLALRPAFDEPGRAQLVRQIASAEPPRLDRIDPTLPRDLATIVHKAMAREPADRYPTPGALAEDLRRYLGDQPIRARQVGPAEQVWRWCRRNPTVAALVGTALLLFVLLLGAGAWAAHLAKRRRQEALERQEVEAALNQADQLRQQTRLRDAGRSSRGWAAATSRPTSTADCARRGRTWSWPTSWTRCGCGGPTSGSGTSIWGSWPRTTRRRSGPPGWRWTATRRSWPGTSGNRPSRSVWATPLWTGRWWPICAVTSGRRCVCWNCPATAAQAQPGAIGFATRRRGRTGGLWNAWPARRRWRNCPVRC